MSKFNRDILNQNIEIQLKKKNINKSKLAEILGMSQPNVSKALNPNEKKLLEIRDYNKEHLKKDDIEVVEYFTSQSKKLITDVVNGLHNTMLDNSEVLLVDVNNPYDIQVLEGIQKAKQKLKEKAGKSLNLKN